ncbi:MAG: hypothetical protein ACRBFS_14540 [Aureispira sp.]
MIRFFLLLCCLYGVLSVQATPIEPLLISEQEFKINGEELFFYAFEKGDQILFDLTVLKGNSLKEVEIGIYEGASRWRVEQTTNTLEQRLVVPKRAIYVFRIRSGGPKKVALTIRRVPPHTSRVHFNSYVEWKTVVDTLRPRFRLEQTTVYDTTYQTHYRRVLYKKSQQMTTLLSRTERVSSKTNLQHDNTTSIPVELPALQRNEYLEERLLGWAYWIGVGQEGLENYNQELKKFLTLATAKVTGKNLLAGLALGAYTVASNPPKGDNIIYEIWSTRKSGRKLEAGGNVTAAFGRFSTGNYRTLTIDLNNDNILNGLNVHLKLVAVTEQLHYRKETYQKRLITPLVKSEIKGKIHLVERSIPTINFW